MLKDLPEPDCTESGTDEGRAILQLLHDVAPAAKLAFYTASVSETDFAAGIIRLADAGAQIIVDDVIYFAEPMFQDGIIAQAVDAVKARGVTYFSSAGNDERQSYEATFKRSGDARVVRRAPQLRHAQGAGSAAAHLAGSRARSRCSASSGISQSRPSRVAPARAPMSTCSSTIRAASSSPSATTTWSRRSASFPVSMRTSRRDPIELAVISNSTDSTRRCEPQHRAVLGRRSRQDQVRVVRSSAMGSSIWMSSTPKAALPTGTRTLRARKPLGPRPGTTRRSLAHRCGGMPASRRAWSTSRPRAACRFCSTRRAGDCARRSCG